MEYRKLGTTGVKVPVVSLGCNNFGWWVSEQESIPIIEQAIDAGMNYLDTADVYDKGTSEICVGKAIKGKRDKVILATKFGNKMGNGPNEHGGSRYYINKALEASLKRLQTDYVDVYQMHNPHLSTSLEETLRALDDLIRAGKVRYIGCCNYDGWQLADALATSKLLNLNSFITVQVQYSLIVRRPENELAPCALAHGVGIIPWGPLAGGFLTGKYRQGETRKDFRLGNPSPTPVYNNVLNEANFKKLEKWEAFAKERGHSMGELAIAWLLAKPWVPTVTAGARRPEQIKSNIAAGDWKLTPEELAAVDAMR